MGLYPINHFGFRVNLKNRDYQINVGLVYRADLDINIDTITGITNQTCLVAVQYYYNPHFVFATPS
jgi:hypothetical protein